MTCDVASDKQEYSERLQSELGKFKHSKQDWADLTGIALGTLKNMFISDKPAAIRAGQLHAFWKAEPTIDLHYIITGERTAPKVFIRTEGPVDIITE